MITSIFADMAPISSQIGWLVHADQATLIDCGSSRIGPAALDLGYRWAALQIPVQYLPWTIGHRPARDVEAGLDQIEQALGQLRSLAVRDGSCRDRG